jgi:hypothetical protein
VRRCAQEAWYVAADIAASARLDERQRATRAVYVARRDVQWAHCQPLEAARPLVGARRVQRRPYYRLVTRDHQAFDLYCDVAKDDLWILAHIHD